MSYSSDFGIKFLNYRDRHSNGCKTLRPSDAPGVLHVEILQRGKIHSTCKSLWYSQVKVRRCKNDRMLLSEINKDM